MKVLQFDQDGLSALKAAGFNISDDNDIAEASDVGISIIRPHGRDYFLLQLELPNGGNAAFQIRREETRKIRGRFGFLRRTGFFRAKVNIRRTEIAQPIAKLRRSIPLSIGGHARN